MTGVSGTSLTDEEKTFIEENNIGGVLLFSRNYESPAQLAELVNSIQVLRTEYPILIAVDQEGGRVERFKNPFTEFPSAMDISLTKSPKLCFEVAQIMAHELKACGVNTNFAPVCDILTSENNKVIGDRAYGHEADEVSKFVTAVIRGLQTNEVIACAKHFPGHGGTKKDSHYGLPIVKTSLEQLKEREFVPFSKAVKSRVEMVMMAHLVVDAIDSEKPCSLSEKAYQMLRNDLKFQKVIITDDMQMGAITENYGMQEAAVMAIEAGADIVEYKDLECAQVALEALKEAHKTKRIRNNVINQKSDRVQDLKKRYLSEYRPVYIPDIQKNFSKNNREAFLKILHNSIAEAKAQE
jgi:beta-N-acetylhexosaminidase